MRRFIRSTMPAAILSVAHNLLSSSKDLNQYPVKKIESVEIKKITKKQYFNWFSVSSITIRKEKRFVECDTGERSGITKYMRISAYKAQKPSRTFQK